MSLPQSLNVYIHVLYIILTKLRAEFAIIVRVKLILYIVV
jgi:hypothetical protein